MNFPFENNHWMFVISHRKKEIHNVHGHKANNIDHGDKFWWKAFKKWYRIDESSNKISNAKYYHGFYHMHIVPVIFLETTFLEFS